MQHSPHIAALWRGGVQLNSWSKAKTSLHQRKAFRAVLCPPFNAKMPFSSDKSATTAAATLISVAAARHAVASFISSSTSSYVSSPSEGF